MTIKKILLFSLFCVLVSISVSFSQSINKLLSIYNQKSDLSYQTRKESLGHWIIITRQDLRRMQAYTLEDVLKSIPIFNYGPNESGNYSLILGGFYYAHHNQFALYINDHLVNSGFNGDFSLYADYPLKDVDHIEIYLGPASVILGNTPKLLIIKIYTRKPSRENVSSLRITLNSRGGYNIGFSSAKPINKNYSYSFMYDQTYENFPKFNIQDIEHSRNAFKQYAFINLNHKGYTHFSNWHLDISAVRSKQNVFVGAEFANPVGGINKDQDAYISFTDYFDKSLKLHFGIDMEHKDNYKNSFGFPLYIPYALNQGNIPIFYNLNMNIYKYSGNILKTFTTDRNKLIIGSGFQLLNFDIDNLSYNDIPINSLNKPTHRNYYTAYVEDQFSINKRNLLLGDLKFDRYSYNGHFRNSDYSARIGYISKPKNNMTIKGFLYKTYSPPSFQNILYSGPYYLNNIKYKGLSLETDYNFSKDNIRLLYGYIDMKNTIEPSFNYPYGYYNMQTPIYINIFWLSNTYYINALNKLEFDYFINKMNNPYHSPNEGFSIKLFDRYKNIYFYNELVYRSPFDGYFGTNEKATYMWDSAITYNINPFYSITLKAQNILNSSYKVPVITYDQYGNPNGLYNVNAYPTTFYISLERLF
ncbi:MAG: TonB-dependent receptor [Hydrogenobaculum sp.]|nr:MAG: TonB-dependent receptor [Hydrogenobaculum sp.]